MLKFKLNFFLAQKLLIKVFTIYFIFLNSTIPYLIVNNVYSFKLNFYQKFFREWAQIILHYLLLSLKFISGIKVIHHFEIIYIFKTIMLSPYFC